MAYKEERIECTRNESRKRQQRNLLPRNKPTWPSGKRIPLSLPTVVGSTSVEKKNCIKIKCNPVGKQNSMQKLENPDQAPMGHWAVLRRPHKDEIHKAKFLVLER